MKLIQVFIISPILATRAGLKSLLMDDPRIQIIGEAASLDEVEESTMRIDVVVWSPALSLDRDAFTSEFNDLKLGDTAGLLLIYDDPRVVKNLIHLKLHGWGLLSPEASQAELIAAIAAVSEGLVVTNPIWLNHLTTGQVFAADENNGLVESLTGREMEILQLMALGLTNKQIALKLGISAHTVKFHVSSIFGKMGTTNRTETVKLGLKKGLILL